MKDFLVYRSINWQKHFKAPLPYGVAIKMGHVQNFNQCKKGSPTERIKFIALENEFSELKVWNIFKNIFNSFLIVGNGTENGKEPEANVPQLSRHTGHGGPGSATLVTTVTEAGFAWTGDGPVALGDIKA